MKVTEFFLGFGPRLWSLPQGRDRVRRQGAPARRLRADRRDEQPRGGRRPPTRRAPTGSKPFPRRLSVAVRGLDDALHHRLRPAVRPRVASSACPRRTDHRRDLEARRRADARRSGPASSRATGSSPSTARGSPTGTRSCTTCRSAPGQATVEFVVEPRRRAGAAHASVSTLARTREGDAVGVRRHRADDRRTERAGPVRRLGQPCAASATAPSASTVKALGQVLQPARHHAATSDQLVGQTSRRADPSHSDRARLGGRRHARRGARGERPASPSSCSLLIGINIFVGMFNMLPLLPLRRRPRRHRRLRADPLAPRAGATTPTSAKLHAAHLRRRG